MIHIQRGRQTGNGSPIHQSVTAFTVYYVMNADGNGAIAIAEDLQLALTPTWSPKPLAVSPKRKSSTLWGALKIIVNPKNR